jgi:hypothetical protein
MERLKILAINLEDIVGSGFMTPSDTWSPGFTI